MQQGIRTELHSMMKRQPGSPDHQSSLAGLKMTSANVTGCFFRHFLQYSYVLQMAAFTNKG